VRIARVRSHPLDAESRLRLIAKAGEIGETVAAEARRRVRPKIPAWAAQERQRFAPHVALELLALRQRILTEGKDTIGLALRMCFSSLLVKFMRSGPEAPRDGESKRTGRGIPSHFFAARASELARGLAALDERAPPGTPRPACALGDARAVAVTGPASVDLVLSSPPYAGTYDYFVQHDARFTWLGLPRSEQTQHAQLGARSVGLGTLGRVWRKGRRRWLGEMGRVLKPGAHLILVVGDGVVDDATEDAAHAIADEAPSAGLEPIARASQTRPVRDRRLAMLFAGKPRREHILLLRRC
jgi:hypothetical protein